MQASKPFQIATLLGIPMPVSPALLLGKSNVSGMLTGPTRFLCFPSLFIVTILSSICLSFFPNFSNASKGSTSKVQFGVSLCQRYTSSEECLDNISISEIPIRVCNCAVIVFRKALSGLFTSSSYSGVPSSGMNLRLMVGRFGRKPA